MCITAEYSWWNQAGPCGAQTEKVFCVHCFLLAGNRHQLPRVYLNPKLQVQTSCQSGKGGYEETREKESRINSVAFEQIQILPQGKHKTISLSFSVELKHQQMKYVNCLMKHPSFWRKGHNSITLRTIETNQETTWDQNKGMHTQNTLW